MHRASRFWIPQCEIPSFVITNFDYFSASEALDKCSRLDFASSIFQNLRNLSIQPNVLNNIKKKKEKMREIKLNKIYFLLFVISCYSLPQMRWDLSCKLF